MSASTPVTPAHSVRLGPSQTTISGPASRTGVGWVRLTFPDRTRPRGFPTRNTRRPAFANGSGRFLLRGTRIRPLIPRPIAADRGPLKRRRMRIWRGTRTVVGTPDYMSPEPGSILDGRSDLFAVGTFV